MRTFLTAALAMLAGVTIGGVGVHRLSAQVKPPAYVIGEIDVADPENYAKEYLSRSLKPIITEGGGKFLSRGSKTLSIRGEPPKRIVMIAFENFDKRKLRLLRRATSKLSRMVRSTRSLESMRSKV